MRQHVQTREKHSVCVFVNRESVVGYRTLHDFERLSVSRFDMFNRGTDSHRRLPTVAGQSLGTAHQPTVNNQTVADSRVESRR